MVISGATSAITTSSSAPGSWSVLQLAGVFQLKSPPPPSQLTTASSLRSSRRSAIKRRRRRCRKVGRRELFVRVLFVRDMDFAGSRKRVTAVWDRMGIARPIVVSPKRRAEVNSGGGMRTTEIRPHALQCDVSVAIVRKKLGNSRDNAQKICRVGRPGVATGRDERAAEVRSLFIYFLVSIRTRSRDLA